MEQEKYRPTRNQDVSATIKTSLTSTRQDRLEKLTVVQLLERLLALYGIKRRITDRITGFVVFVYRPEFQITRKYKVSVCVCVCFRQACSTEKS
jgi:hypothetical protein